MAALVAPRLVVVGHDDGVEAALLGEHAELDELARAELLGGGLVADLNGHVRNTRVRGRMDVPAGFTTFEPQGPFLEHIGPVQVREDADGLVFGLRAEERHTNHRGTIQGGLLSTFADFALGRAIGAGADDDKARATVSLTVDFLRPASPATGSSRARGSSAWAARSRSPTCR